MPTTICYLCQSPAVEAVRDRLRHGVERRVLRCGDCDLVWLDPAAAIGTDLYRRDYRSQYSPILGRAVSAQEIFDIYRPFQQERVDRIRDRLDPQARCLDIGCSAGHLMDALAPLVGEIEGLELSQENAQFVEWKLGHTVHQVPVEALDRPDSHYDLITAYQVLEHIEDPLPFLRAIRRLLRPGGTVIIEVPNLDDALLSVYDCEPYADFWFREVHAFYYSPTTLLGMTNAAGLEGEVSGVQTYNTINQLNWILAGKPQPSAKIAMGTPALEMPGASPELRTDLERWLQQMDRSYREIVERHHVSDALLFVGGAGAN